MVCALLHVPPFRSTEQRQRKQCRTGSHGDTRSAHAGRWWHLPGWHRTFAYRGANDREHSRDQQRTECNKDYTHAALHTQCASGTGLHRDDYGAAAGRPLHRDVHRVDTGGHDPQVMCPHAGIARNQCGVFSRRRALGAHVPLCRTHRDASRCSTEYAHRDWYLCRHNPRGIDQHTHGIAAGQPFEHHLIGADVRRQQRARQQETAQNREARANARHPPTEARHASGHHRRTERSQLPQPSPTRADNTASTPAIPNARTVCDIGSSANWRMGRSQSGGIMYGMLSV